MYIIAESAEELEARLEITAKEAEKHGCTWSISKFHAAGMSALSLDIELSLTRLVPAPQKLALTPVELRN